MAETPSPRTIRFLLMTLIAATAGCVMVGFGHTDAGGTVGVLYGFYMVGEGIGYLV